MAHNNRTPRSVLDAPRLTPVTVWHPRRQTPRHLRKLGILTLGTFRGSVAADLLGSPRPAQLAARKARRGNR